MIFAAQAFGSSNLQRVVIAFDILAVEAGALANDQHFALGITNVCPNVCETGSEVAASFDAEFDRLTGTVSVS